MAGNLRVQEYIARSGRYHLSQRSFDNIRSAYIEMRARARRTMWEYRTYDFDDSFVEHAHLETDYDTYIDVVSDGGAKRRFTLVTKRGGESVPWGHLLDKKGQV